MIKIYFIGTGGGAPNKRGLPAYLVQREGLYALFDVGEGTQQRLIDSGLGFMRIRVIGITHLHGDHVLGLPGLLETMGMYSRKEKLTLLGPPELRDFVSEVFNRTYFRPNYEIEFAESYEDSNIRITKFRTCHVVNSYGFIFEEKDRINIDAERLRREGIKDWRIMRLLKDGKRVEIGTKVLLPEDYLVVKKGIKVAYTGDTAPCNDVINAVREVDLLLHDSTFLNEKEAYEYGHSNSKDAAVIATKANVKRLALIHISPRYDDATPLLKEAMKVFEKTFLPEPFSYYILQG
ncbi:MAG: ribonuclease Z [Sulfolobaceae archaeon]